MININCNLCGENNYSILILSADKFYGMEMPVFSVVKCRNCGLVYINPQPTNEELRKHYPENYGPYQDNFSLLKYNKFFLFLKNKYNSFKKQSEKKEIEKLDLSKKTFLDFGCGSGVYLEKIRRLHPRWELYGLDNNEFACKNTKEKGFNVFCGDLLEVNINNDFFDEVYMGQVIEHVFDPRKVVKKLSLIMKKGGNLTLATPNIDSITAKLFGSFWFALEVPRHLFLFSPKTLSKILEDEGFKVMDIQFDKEPKTAIRSINYLLNKKFVNINPILWHTLWVILKPISTFLSFFGKTSIMVVRATKL